MTDEQFGQILAFTERWAFSSEIATFGVDIFIEDVPAPECREEPRPRIVVNQADYNDLRDRMPARSPEGRAAAVTLRRTNAAT